MSNTKKVKKLLVVLLILTIAIASFVSFAVPIIVLDTPPSILRILAGVFLLVYIAIAAPRLIAKIIRTLISKEE